MIRSLLLASAACALALPAAAQTVAIVNARIEPVSSAAIQNGVLIIKDGKIAAAGCFLPLTKNPNVDKSFGTRHRAAIGLTEDTDAVVVLVSEKQKGPGSGDRVVLVALPAHAANDVAGATLMQTVTLTFH